MHDEDGTSEPRVVKFTDDLADWWVDKSAPIPDTKVGRRGTIDAGTKIVLSELVWKNPHPEKKIVTIDFLSAKAKAAPFLVGVTLE